MDFVNQFTDKDKERISQLEKESHRSSMEDYELQELYLHRWLWAKFKHSLGIITPVVDKRKRRR